MHPASSVVFFTTATGAGYGFMAALAISLLAGGDLPGPAGRLAFFAVGFALIVGGLLASTLHLGHPERAWRALTQWRSSWLSREGVLAVFFFLPGGVFALLAAFRPLALTGAAGGVLLVVVAVSAMAVVFATGMIYAQLKAVPAWHDPLVPAGYLALAAATGTTLLCALKSLAGLPLGAEYFITQFLIVIAGLVKAFYWIRLRGGAAAATAATAASATGLGGGGEVRLLDGPHTQANYLLKEMGFRVARERAESLRWLAIGLGFAAPAGLLWLGGPSGAGPLAAAAFVAMMAGVACERWLFFAEAKHVVTLFYGAQRV